MRAIIRTSIILCFVFIVFPANTQSLSENYEEMIVDAVKTGESLKVQVLISKLTASNAGNDSIIGQSCNLPIVHIEKSAILIYTKVWTISEEKFLV